MAREKFNLVPEQELKSSEIKYQIETGSMTNTVYTGLSLTEQNNVKKTLFEMFSQPVVTPAALSGLEFTIFGLAKLFYKKDSGVALTTAEQAFYDRFKKFIDQHEITLDANDWYIPYAEDKMLLTKASRAEYKTKKTNITGSF